MKKSMSLTGRAASKRAFLATQELGGCYAVTAFTTYRGHLFYADPSYVGKRKNLVPLKLKRQSSKFRYRVIVTPKKDRQMKQKIMASLLNVFSFDELWRFEKIFVSIEAIQNRIDEEGCGTVFCAAKWECLT